MVLDVIKANKKLASFSVGMMGIMVCATVWVNYVKSVHHDMLVNYDESTAEIPFDQYDYDINLEKSLTDKNFILDTKRLIRKINKDEVLHNKHLLLIKKQLIIVVQVNNEPAYLQGLVHSLMKVVGISKALIIFSHKIYDNEINDIIRQITFTTYLQIFYPFSSQLYPDRFPGDDLQLCTGDFICQRSVMRVMKSAQKKHFWWWQVTQIFEHLRTTNDFNGTVIFLEENQYVLRDFVYVLQVMEVMMANNCLDCEIISLGAHRRNLEDIQIRDTNVTIYSWNSVQSNIAIAFNRSVWNSIKRYRYHFCHYNDFRWDMSLKYLATKRHQKFFKLFATDAARVIKYKDCNENVYCSKDEDVWQVMEYAKEIKREKDSLPRRFIVKAGETETSFKEPPAGDWDDVRDRELCMYFLKGFDIF